MNINIKLTNKSCIAIFGMFLCYISVDISAQQNIEKIYESNVTINLKKSCIKDKPRNKDDYENALLKAKMSILDQRFSNEAASVTNDFNSSKDNFIRAIDEILINQMISTNCKNNIFKLALRTNLNESLISNLLIGKNQAMISGPRSRVSAVFLARRQTSVQTFQNREVEAEKAGSSLQIIGESSDVNGQYSSSESSSSQSFSESGGSVIKKADKKIWDVSTSNDLDAAVSQTFSSFGYRFIDIAQVEAISGGALSVDQFKVEFGSGNDLSSSTQASVFGALSGKIPIFVISTIDIGVADQNPVSGQATVYVSVTAKAYQDDGLFYGTVASVEPQQFSASGPNQTVAETRALVKAARSASEEVVRQLYAANIF